MKRKILQIVYITWFIRYSDSSLTGIIQDIHILSHTDYLVCTFSSTVGFLQSTVLQIALGVASLLVSHVNIRYHTVYNLAGVPDCVRADAAAPRGRQLQVQVSGRHLVLRRPGGAPAGGSPSTHAFP